MKTPPLTMTHDNFCAIVDPRSPNPKTETRRLLTIRNLTQELVNELKSFYQDGDGNWIGCSDDSPNHAEWVKKAYPKGSNKGIKSKHQVGDHCYLTEPTQVIELNLENALVQYSWKAGRKLLPVTESDLKSLNGRKTGCYSKQIPRFMLKSFARYWVEIVDVKIERLLDITAEGAIAEGIKSCKNIYGEVDKPYYWDYVNNAFTHIDPIQSYLSEIAYIHPATKDKIGGWDLVKSNPWLWVYTFKLVGEK